MEEKMELYRIPHIYHRFVRLLLGEYQSADTRRLELNRTHLKTLMLLRHWDKRMTMSELGSLVNLEKGSLTSVVDTLIEKGLVQRERDKEDRRRVFIGLTPEGEKMAYRFQQELNEYLEERLSCLEEDEQVLLRQQTAMLEKIIKRWEK